ncbi:MAG: pdxT, partial [Paenibacillus sp.]|nr:pdxT [Paenibacillus sp.]
AEGVPVKKTSQLAELDGIIIPGGESTTIGKLMRDYGFIEEVRSFSKQGKPIFGTCAGLIVLADEIVGQEQAHLQLMDMKVQRNAFGRQRESFETELAVKGVDDKVRAVFIRAPLIREIGDRVDVLSEHNGEIVAARQDHLLAVSFHPELTDDYRMHQYFIDMVKEAKSSSVQ